VVRFRIRAGNIRSFFMVGVVKIRELSNAIHQNAVKKGFWDGKDHSPEWAGAVNQNIPQVLMLIVSEVSEALEAYRNHDYENFCEELADIAIRLFDFAEAMDIDIEAEIIQKHHKNVNRQYRHGGKAC